MSSSNYSENFIPVKAIINNMIELDSGEKIAGVKVLPKNIFILEEGDRYSVIDGLRNMYNSLDFEFWLIVADRQVDITMYIAELQMQYNKTQDPVIRKLINQDLDKADDFNKDVSDIEFYFLYKTKDIDELNKRTRIIINGLANAGLASNQANNDDLRSILDNFLNGGIKTEFGTVMG